MSGEFKLGESILEHFVINLLLYVRRREICEALHKFAEPYITNSLLTCAILARAILDYVPPFFDFTKFRELAANLSNNRSLKQQLGNLEGSTRKLADSVLHKPIGHKFIAINKTSVDCKQSLDALLREYILRLESNEIGQKIKD